MKRRNRLRLTIFACIALLIFGSIAGMAVAVENSNEKTISEQTVPPATPQGVDSQLAVMSDAEVRKAYSEKLKADASGKADAPAGRRHTTGISPVEEAFKKSVQNSSSALQRMGQIFTGVTEKPGVLENALRKLAGGKGWSHLFLTLLITVAIISFGLLLRFLFHRKTRDIQETILGAARLGKLQLIGRIASRVLLNLTGIGVYMLATFILMVAIYDEQSIAQLIPFTAIFVSYYAIVIIIAAKIIFSPHAPAVRLFPMADADALFLYRWIKRIAFLSALIVGIGRILLNAGISLNLFHAIYSLAGISVILAIMVMIWQSRTRVKEAILFEQVEPSSGKASMAMHFAAYWHWIALLYVLAMGAYWVADFLLRGNVTVLNLIMSIFLIPVFIGIDQWVVRLLKMASGEGTQFIDLGGEEKTEPVEPSELEDKKDLKSFVPVIKRLFRFFLLAGFFFFFLKMWGIDIAFGRVFTRSILSLLLVLVTGFVIWELIKAKIDRKLKEEMPDDDEDMEEGGAGGSRTGTLLLLLRKFVMAVLFVIVVLMALSSIGIDIAPLIAGAGVFGLALGFGAQTLVKDIIAGIFFLIDDAFRVGDYIQAAGAKGMVEQISLRSLKLRHPRGMVYNIPFGGMGSVQNFSRDYIITKLDFRVRYDVDLEKIRKIVKKINKKIAKDPELGHVMLDKIKSQGVREMDDSAMIMRVKFKTIPGEQFMVRREVYRLMQESFQANGIEFAHRNVTVYLPENHGQEKDGDAGSETPKTDPKLLEAAGAAGAAVIAAEEQKLAEEEAKKGKK